ncbi:uncharacterized protein [Temnothorax longispinosus]|uniref:uncharacterized protein n=1 Tax=Temnothorax longispinosus TaxID=300112 RepID=UPI003A99124A
MTSSFSPSLPSLFPPSLTSGPPYPYFSSHFPSSSFHTISFSTTQILLFSTLVLLPLSLSSLAFSSNLHLAFLSSIVKSSSTPIPHLCLNSPYLPNRTALSFSYSISTISTSLSPSTLLSHTLLIFGTLPNTFSATLSIRPLLSFASLPSNPLHTTFLFLLSLCSLSSSNLFTLSFSLLVFSLSLLSLLSASFCDPPPLLLHSILPTSSISFHLCSPGQPPLAPAALTLLLASSSTHLSILSPLSHTILLSSSPPSLTPFEAFLSSAAPSSAFSPLNPATSLLIASFHRSASLLFSSSVLLPGSLLSPVLSNPLSSVLPAPSALLPFSLALF